MTKYEKIKRMVMKDTAKSKLTGLPVIRTYQTKSFMELGDEPILGGWGMPAMSDMVLDLTVSKGFKPGDLTVFAAGRGSGKTMMTQMVIHKAREDAERRMRTPLHWESEPQLKTQWTSYSLPFGLYSHRPLKYDEVTEMKEFCNDTFGRGGKLGGSRWACGSQQEGCFWFGTERDRIVFKMAFEGHVG